jgi:hypothetical protein
MYRSGRVTGTISSTESGTGATSNTATLTVVGPPSIMKGFDASTIPMNGPSVLSFTITNPNGTSVLSFTITNPNATVALTGVGFAYTFPSGMIVETPPNATDTCGGTFAPVSGATSLIFTGGTLAAGGFCALSVDVKLTTSGPKQNTTGPGTSNEGGTGTTSNTATVATFDICLKDDNTGDLIQWSSTSGDYLFTHCGAGGFTLTGTGTVSVASGVQQLKDKKPDRNINAGFVISSQTGPPTSM